MIRNVVFDVGGVLVRLHYQQLVRYLGAAGIDMSDLPAWLATIDLYAHERGEISGEQMLDRIAAQATQPLDRADLTRRWLAMFERWDEMFDLAHGLMDDYRVYLLSNVGDMHWAYLDEHYGVDQLVHGSLASFRVGAVKPSAEIYRKAERMFDLEPAATVFIDDLSPNVAGAQACGWQAILHREARATRDQLRALGVKLPKAFAAEG
jgi:FMN phosphatase YigB (HAD superfamily)